MIEPWPLLHLGHPSTRMSSIIFVTANLSSIGLRVSTENALKEEFILEDADKLRSKEINLFLPRPSSERRRLIVATSV